jgi:hypothetical protein
MTARPGKNIFALLTALHPVHAWLVAHACKGIRNSELHTMRVDPADAWGMLDDWHARLGLPDDLLNVARTALVVYHAGDDTDAQHDMWQLLARG